MYVDTERRLRHAQVIAAALASLLFALTQAAVGFTAHNTPQQINLGLEGLVELRWDGPALEPKSQGQTRTSPIQVRVVGPLMQNGAAVYQLHYIGTRAGRYDLRDYVQRRDGEPLVGLDPLPIEIGELLPPDFVGNLANASDPALPRPWPYRTLLLVGGIVWVALALRFIVRRVAARPRHKFTNVQNVPSLADRLRPLVEAALQGNLTAADKAQLEQLLIGHWRQRLGGEGVPPLELLQRMRNDPEAGELLTQLETWLHRPPRPETVDIAELLRPYRHAAEPRGGVADVVILASHLEART